MHVFEHCACLAFFQNLKEINPCLSLKIVEIKHIDACLKV